MKPKKTVLQIRYRDDGLRVTCNQYLEAFSPDFCRVVVFLTGLPVANEDKTIDADEIISLELSKKINI